MTPLAIYVEQKNRIRVMFGGQKEALDVTKPEDRQFLAECIDNELSPENLTCDGELSRTQIARKQKMLLACQRELLELAGSR